MLKKLVPTLALTSLAFGSGLCFNPYNHNYGINIKQLNAGNLYYNKTLILHDGKMQVDRRLERNIKLIKYRVNGNKALILMRGAGQYFVVYTECINGKPVTKDAESIGVFSAALQTVNLPKYPIKLGFYKDGYWVKYFTVGFTNGWIGHPSRNYCYYETDYFPYKLIDEHKADDGPMKFHNFPTSVCNPIAKEKLGA